MSFDIIVRPRLGTGLDVLELIGAVDMSTVDVLADRLKGSFSSGSRKIVVDMKKLESFSSAGWGTLVEWKWKFQQEGGSLVVSGMNEAQQRVYELMGLEASFSQYTDVDSAVDGLTGGAK
jgi:anti-anti-sigma factor